MFDVLYVGQLEHTRDFVNKINKYCTVVLQEYEQQQQQQQQQQ